MHLKYLPLASLPILAASCGAAPASAPAVAPVAASAAASDANANANANAGPIAVRVEKKGAGFQLTRGGAPYFIKGAGGDGSKEMLRAAGANSFRTWGADNSQKPLDEAQKLGLTMTLGIWLGHKDHGFNYLDAAQVQAQVETAKAAIDRYKNHPALLAWGIGNEMEMGLNEAEAEAMWKSVEQIAAHAKKVDPNHPTMTIIAELGGDKIAQIHKLCPSVDIVGINSYGGGPSVPERYAKAGGAKPYVLTEFGPPGTWEVGKKDWGASLEMTSTEKGARYGEVYDKAIANQPLCLGSYAFTWGNKQEATATWFGLLLPDGSRLDSADALVQRWSGKPPANRAPAIQKLALASGDGKVAAGSTLRATLETSDAEKDALKVEWVLQADPMASPSGGGFEASPRKFPEAIVKGDARGAEVKAPAIGGAYRLFAYVRDNKGGAAVANVPLLIEGGAKPARAVAPRATLPLALYTEGGGAEPFVPAGYMGNAGAIKMDPAHEGNPHSGKTCLKVSYGANDNWGGVVWQSPAEDWGDAPGGWNLDGATKLSFWARGDKGGETVNFSFGLIANNKPFPDTGGGKLDAQKLTTEWKRYEMDVSNLDLSRIKTGFVWTLAATGAPVTFYLDDIRWE